MRDTTEEQAPPRTRASSHHRHAVPGRAASLVSLLLLVASCGGGGGSGPGATPSPGLATATPGPHTTPTPSPAETPPSEPIDFLRRAPAFSLLGGGPVDLPPSVSRDGRVVAYPQQDVEGFTYEDPSFPGFIRMGYIYCARALAWRDGGPPVALDPDPGCPFAETPGMPYGESWPAALGANGALALVNRRDYAATPYAWFGLAGADGGWEEVRWQVDHPLEDRVPNYDANDMTDDGSIVVGTAWLERPWPGWDPSDARPWRWTRGSSGPVWLPAGADAIESALFVSDDGGVIVGCCDEDASNTRSLPVVWHGDAAPETLAPLYPDEDYGEQCRAAGLSGDGRVVVGACGARAVRWVDGVPSEIPVPGEPPPSDRVVVSQALAVSVDGTVVLGRTSAVGLENGWLWSEADGLQPVRDLLVAAGIDVGDGSVGSRVLYPPMAFARDGKVLVGRGGTGVGASFFEFVYRATLP